MQHAKIVGGAEAQTMIPWQVALLSDNFQFCGGTILDSCTILSAAHCGINKAHKIRAGSKNRKNGGQVINHIFDLGDPIIYFFDGRSLSRRKQSFLIYK